MKVTVIHLPSDSNSNVLVPPHIQGKEAELISRARWPNQHFGSRGHQIAINGQGYNVPCWAIRDLNGERVSQLKGQHE